MAEDTALPVPANVLLFVGTEALRNLARSQYSGYSGAAELLATQEEVSA